MGITDKTRKMLWGRSGNLCAICRKTLVIEAPPSDVNSIVGEECHIISGQAQGPRYDPSYPRNLVDAFDNLLLLCSVHHKMVDDQWGTYTPDLLRQIKGNHEKWVSQKLAEQPKKISIKRINENVPIYLVKLDSGKELFEIVNGADAFGFDNDELNTDEEVYLIGSFFQRLETWINLSAELEPYDKVKIEFDLSSDLKQLEHMGFFTFGGFEIRKFEGGELLPSDWKVAIVHVIRSSTKMIQYVQFWD